jgi:hypothetical protein
MPQVLSRALVLGGLALCTVGCSSRFQRSKYDPFATGKPGNSKTEHGLADNPQLVPAGIGGEEVAQAGREFHSRRPVAERSQHAQISSDRLRENARNSSGDSSESETSARSAMRPTAGRPLGHAPDYSWVQGKLEYTNLGGGIWRVRYAPLSADDEHGGCVILQSLPNTQQFRHGDIVYAEGRIVEPNTRGPLPNPVYRVDLMNRAAD